MGLREALYWCINVNENVFIVQKYWFLKTLDEVSGLVREKLNICIISRQKLEIYEFLQKLKAIKVRFITQVISKLLE